MSKPKASSLNWEEPSHRETYDWEAIAAGLRRRPGKWAKIFEEDRASLATAIRQANGIQALLPRKGFEVRTRNNRRGTPRTCTMYLRYVPEKDEEK